MPQPHKKMTIEEKYKICEMYKAHYTAVEVTEKLDRAYMTIHKFFMAFKYLEVEKYDRSTLMEQEDFEHERASSV